MLIPVLLFIVNAAPTVHNEFATDILITNRTSLECRQAIQNASKSQELVPLFEYTSLFFATPEICKQVDLVSSYASYISDACEQTITPNQTWQRDGIYKIWSNEAAANSACAYQHELYCIESVFNAAYSTNATELCTLCQRNFWSSFRDDYAPHLYYWSYGNQQEYRIKIKNVCGNGFFDETKSALY